MSKVDETIREIKDCLNWCYINSKRGHVGWVLDNVIETDNYVERLAEIARHKELESIHEMAKDTGQSIRVVFRHTDKGIKVTINVGGWKRGVTTISVGGNIKDVLRQSIEKLILKI